MFRLIKSMLYRATHDIFFYIAALFCIAVTILIVNGNSPDLRNHVTSSFDQNVIVNYEEEDALNVQKHNIFGDLVVHNVPGHDIIYRDSLCNVVSTSDITVFISICILLISILYAVIFFSEMFRKGAIRNMITAGLTKPRCFIASVIVYAVLLVVLAMITAAVVLVFSLVAGLYPIIYWPSLLVFLAAEFLVGILAGMIVILIVFMTQRPVRSILAVVACVILFSILNNTVDLSVAFDIKYKQDNDAFSKFIKSSEQHAGDEEWYLPISNFNYYEIYKADGTLYKEFSTDELDPNYSGDTKVAIARVAWRLNVGLLPLETELFSIYPMYRDGVLLRYIVVSSVYGVILLAAGCAVVRKRNIN